MKTKKIRQKAAELGLEAGDMKQVDLIRNIQIKEGNFPCFGTGRESCDQINCCWRGDCLSTEQRNALHLEQIKAELEDFKKSIDEFKARTKKLVGKNKSEVLKEFKKLEKKSEEELRLTVQTLGETSERAWKNTKKGIDSTWKDLAKSIKKLMTRY